MIVYGHKLSSLARNQHIVYGNKLTSLTRKLNDCLMFMYTNNLHWQETNILFMETNKQSFSFLVNEDNYNYSVLLFLDNLQYMVQKQ